MLKVTHLLRQSFTKTSPAQYVRSYFKPSQKEVFHDVEGVVTKDILLFRFDETGNVLTRSMFAILMLPLGTYLGYSAYQFRWTQPSNLNYYLISGPIQDLRLSQFKSLLPRTQNSTGGSIKLCPPAILLALHIFCLEPDWAPTGPSEHCTRLGDLFFEKEESMCPYRLMALQVVMRM